MLKVSYSRTEEGERWTLCGRLADQWVDELYSLWSSAREQASHAHVVVDLTDVVFIDDAGERLLAAMEISGVEFLAAGVENKHLIAEIKSRTHHFPRREAEHWRDSRTAGSLAPGKGSRRK